MLHIRMHSSFIFANKEYRTESPLLGDDVSLRLMLACELRFGGCDDYSMNQTEERWELSTLAVYFQFTI